jgi:transcriptional regulator with XRE-family HTH domain
MSRGTPRSPTVVGRRMRMRREELAWPQERVGVLIGIDESSSRARISRYELGVHEPPVQTARLIADALGVPLTYLFCEDDQTAALLLSLHQLSAGDREASVRRFSQLLKEGYT